MTLQKLSQLLGCDLGRHPATTTSGRPAAFDQPVTGVTEDSRRVQPGSVFVAVSGGHHDGHEFADGAVGAGAIAVIGSHEGTESCYGVPYLHVANPRHAAGVVAHAIAGDPTLQMTVVGVTGTNGKSSTVLMVQHLLEWAGMSTACLGTLGYRVGGETLTAPHTTPFGEDLAAMFAKAYAAGQRHAVMEVSSHAIEQDRIAGIHFKAAAFTNLTQDHLDYHRDMDTYRATKRRLFEGIRAEDGFTVVNADDPSAPAFIGATNARCYTYGVEGVSRAIDTVYGVRETRFTAQTPWGEEPITMGLIGQHNVSNAMCALSIVCGLGVPLSTVAEALGTLQTVPGRFERVDAGQDFLVIVDYAHTDDGLKNVLQAARAVCDGRIICVFGCGGDRDKGKRPKMAAVAAELADFSVITSDNPRTEDPHQILLDIEAGSKQAGQKLNEDYVLQVDRREAIAQGIAMARPGDLVLIAGKGHEDYQILGTTKIHFDDREVARELLEAR